MTLLHAYHPGIGRSESLQGSEGLVKRLEPWRQVTTQGVLYCRYHLMNSPTILSLMSLVESFCHMTATESVYFRAYFVGKFPGFLAWNRHKSQATTFTETFHQMRGPEDPRLKAKNRFWHQVFHLQNTGRPFGSLQGLNCLTCSFIHPLYTTNRKFPNCYQKQKRSHSPDKCCLCRFFRYFTVISRMSAFSSFE